MSNFTSAALRRYSLHRLAVFVIGVALLGSLPIAVSAADIELVPPAPTPVPDAVVPTVKLPATVTAKRGLVVVTAETNCSNVVWMVPPDSGLQLLPTELLPKNSKTIACVALEDGRYLLYAIVAKGDVPTVACTTVVVGTPPVPVPPGPEPGPTPDAFTQSVISAAAQESVTDKALVSTLAKLFLNADSVLNQSNVKTTGDLFAALGSYLHDAKTGVPATSLLKVRKVIGQDLNTVLGGTSEGVDPSKPLDKATISKAFAKYAAALNAAK